MAHLPAPNRRTVLAGAFGVGALGGVGLTPDAASASLGDVTIPDTAGAFYLALASVPGDATVRGFEGQIALLTFGWGAHNSSDPLAGSGSGVGKPSPDDLVAVAYAGVHSPLVSAAVNTGRTLSTATLSCVRKGSKPSTFLTVALQNVVVTSYYLTPDVSSGRPLDVFHLKYTRVTHSVVPQNPDGTAGTPITTGFDYRAGTST